MINKEKEAGNSDEELLNQYYEDGEEGEEEFEEEFDESLEEDNDHVHVEDNLKISNPAQAFGFQRNCDKVLQMQAPSPLMAKKRTL